MTYTSVDLLEIEARFCRGEEPYPGALSQTARRAADHLRTCPGVGSSLSGHPDSDEGVVQVFCGHGRRVGWRVPFDSNNADGAALRAAYYAEPGGTEAV